MAPAAPSLLHPSTGAQCLLPRARLPCSNNRVASWFIEDMPVHKAAFAAGGSKVGDGSSRVRLRRSVQGGAAVPHRRAHHLHAQHR